MTTATVPVCTCGKKKVPNIGFSGKCPNCKTRLEFEVNVDGTKSRHLICPNLDCSGATFGLIMNWVRAHEIRGLGQRVVRGLITEGITTPAGLYTATADIFAKACNSQKNGDKLYNNVQATKKMKLATFLTGLNLIGLGRTNGKKLAKEFGTLDAVMASSTSDIASIQGIKTKAKAIRAGLDRRQAMVDKIAKVVNVMDFIQQGPLAGKSFAMTGLRNHNGVRLSDVIEQHGGEVKSSVSKDLHYLIILDPTSTSSKANKARSYGVKLISPDDFLKMV